MRKKSQAPDIFTPDGFNAALMIVQALKKGGDDVDKMIDALEGYRFRGPKGQNAVRPQDHALLQPMFQVQLTKAGSRLVAKTIDTATPYETAPPVKPISR
jgi:branched-chain amino acid transport system substrate-binding protein